MFRTEECLSKDEQINFLQREILTFQKERQENYTNEEAPKQQINSLKVAT